MSDHIKREDAIRQIVKTSAQNELDIHAIGTVIYILSEMDSADVVEVVRCRDCKYAEVADPEDSQDGYICQFHRGCIWFSGSFCSYGERADT